MRFWESSEYFIVLGRISKAGEDIDLQAVRKDGLKVLRRASGGGTILQGKGCLNYTLILSKGRKEVQDLKSSYDYILGKITSSLRALGIESRYHPPCDIALAKGSKKFSGNAQKRGRKYIMHHGTILYGMDLRLIDRYLFMPKQTPVYREGRTHAQFIANVPCRPKELMGRLVKDFGGGGLLDRISGEERAALDGLLAERSGLAVNTGPDPE